MKMHYGDSINDNPTEASIASAMLTHHTSFDSLIDDDVAVLDSPIPDSRQARDPSISDSFKIGFNKPDCLLTVGSG